MNGETIDTVTDKPAGLHLPSEAEERWGQLANHLDYVAKFWIGFLFTPSPPIAREFRQRMAVVEEDQVRAFVTRTLRTPEEVMAVQDWLVADERTATAGCFWIQSLEWDALGAIHRPWEAAWRHLFMRLNHQRDAMRREMNTGLMFVVPPPAKSVLRETAPDLWSIREIVIELDGIPSSFRANLDEHSRSFSLMNLNPLAAMMEAERLQRRAAELNKDGGVAIALTLADAAADFLAQGKFAQSKDAACRALNHLDASEEPLLSSRILATRAETEYALNELATAEEHVRRAIEIRSNMGQSSSIPLQWYMLAGKLAVRRSDTSTALQWYDQALQQVRTHGPTEATTLASTLQEARIQMRIAEAYAWAGRGKQAMREAMHGIALCRDAVTAWPMDYGAERALFQALLDMGEIQNSLGDNVGARASLREAVIMARALLSRGNDESAALRQLSYALNRLAEAVLDADEPDEALRHFGYALEIRRRLLATTPNDPDALRDVASSLRKIARIQRDVENVAVARRLLDELISLEERRMQLLGTTHPGIVRSLAIA